MSKKISQKIFKWIKTFIIKFIIFLFIISWINYASMFVILYMYFGGSPSSQQGGGVDSSGEFMLRDHGRVTIVSENLYDYLIFYEVISKSLILLSFILVVVTPGARRNLFEGSRPSILDKPVKLLYFLKKRKKRKYNDGEIMEILLENYDDNKNSIDIIRESGDEEAKKMLSEYETKKQLVSDNQLEKKQTDKE